MATKGVTGGPARSIKWAGINFTPSMDGESEYELSDRDYEGKVGGDGSIYSEGKAVMKYYQHDVVLTTAEYDNVVKFKDGNTRSGSVTLANGDVLSLNCLLDGEFKLKNGVAPLKLSGQVKKQ